MPCAFFSSDFLLMPMSLALGILYFIYLIQYRHHNILNSIEWRTGTGKDWIHLTLMIFFENILDFKLTYLRIQVYIRMKTTSMICIKEFWLNFKVLKYWFSLIPVSIPICTIYRRIRNFVNTGLSLFQNTEFYCTKVKTKHFKAYFSLFFSPVSSRIYLLQFKNVVDVTQLKYAQHWRRILHLDPHGISSEIKFRSYGRFYVRQKRFFFFFYTERLISISFKRTNNNSIISLLCEEEHQHTQTHTHIQ